MALGDANVLVFHHQLLELIRGEHLAHVGKLFLFLVCEFYACCGSGFYIILFHHVKRFFLGGHIIAAITVFIGVKSGKIIIVHGGMFACGSVVDKAVLRLIDDACGGFVCFVVGGYPVPWLYGDFLGVDLLDSFLSEDISGRAELCVLPPVHIHSQNIACVFVEIYAAAVVSYLNAAVFSGKAYGNNVAVKPQADIIVSHGIAFH